MYIWKCNAYLNMDGDYDVLGKNVNSIPYQDIGRPYTVVDSSPAIETEQSLGTDNPQELYDFLVSLYGLERTNLLFGVPMEKRYSRNQEVYENLFNMLPTLRYGYPNITEMVLNAEPKSDSIRTLVLYIPGLSRVLKYVSNRVSTTPKSGLYIYKVENSIVTTNLVETYSTSSRCFVPSMITNTSSWDSVVIDWFCYNGDFSIESLSNPQNNSELTVGARKRKGDSYFSTLYQRGRFPEGWGTILSAIFGDYTEPDFSFPDNPYEPGGESGEGGGGGSFDDTSDPIPDSSLPTISAANTGFTRIYNPTLSQVQDLARYLWTDSSVIETIWNHIKQFFENPMDAIIGFNLVPVPVPNGGVENFALMYIDTGVQMTVAANQFVDLDCGTVTLERYYGSALDQSPYTKISCFLPYIGTVNLNTDEVMGTTLQVKYRVDIVSGSCVAKIFVDGNCLYQYSGHCAITIPISSADFSSYVSAAISVGKLAAAAITAGAGAAMASGVADASQQTNQIVTTTQVTNTARNPSTGRQVTTGTTTTVQTRESPADQSSTQASFSGLSPQNVANTVGAIMSSKPHIEHSGSFSGNSGYLGVRRPFLIIERPNMCMPANYQALNGFPAMITMELSTCKGFTRVQQVQLTGMGRATNPEQAEILELLKLGVIL